MTRLSPERLAELYAGALRLVSEHGYDKVTMDQVAEATKSSKATLYRQWGSKAALVVEALHSVTVIPDEPPDTGSLRGDLVEMVARRSTALDPTTPLIGSVLHAVKTDEALRTAVRQRIVAILHERLALVTGRAVARGEVDADNPALAHVDLVLMAPFVLRVLIDDTPPDDAYLIAYLDAVLLPALGI